MWERPSAEASSSSGDGLGGKREEETAAAASILAFPRTNKSDIMLITERRRILGKFPSTRTVATLRGQELHLSKTFFPPHSEEEF